MTAPIMQALNSGFTSQQIIDYIIKKFPQHAKKILQALSMGYAPSQVLSYLSGGKKSLNTDEVAQTEHEATMKSDKRRRNTNNALVAGTAAAAAGGLGFGLSRIGASNAIQSQILPAVTASPLPFQPIQPGPGIGQQMQQQAQAPVMGAMQPTQSGQVAQASQAIQPQPTQTQSIFDQLTSGYDIANLDPEKQQQLKFLNLISDQLQSQGKDIKDPAFKNLAKKIQDVFKGKPGVIVRENARFEEGKKQEPATIQKAKELAEKWKLAKEKDPKFPHSLSKILQTNLGVDEKTANDLAKAFEPGLQQNTPANTPAPEINTPVKQEKRIDPDARYPKQFFHNKKKEEIDAFANERLEEAFVEIEKGIAAGEDYGVFHGDEWQSVGNKDVNEGAPNAPNEPKRHIGPGKKLIQVIEEHVPTRGLYQYYFNTPEKRKRMPFNKFSRGYEKAVEEMITKKTNPELYKKLQEQENEFLNAISKNEIPKNDLFDEMKDEIEAVLFRQYDEEYEEYLTRMIKKIR